MKVKNKNKHKNKNKEEDKDDRNLTYPELKYHLKVLVEHGLIFKDNKGKFGMTEKGKEMMRKGTYEKYISQVIKPEQDRILAKLEGLPKVNIKDIPERKWKGK